MTVTLLRRSITLRSLVVNSHFLSRVASFCSRASTNLDDENERQTKSTNYSSRIHLSPLFDDRRPHFDGYNIELVDDDTWKVSAGLAHAWRGSDEDMEAKCTINEVDDDAAPFEGDSDFDEIDNMRIRGDLFYKLDKDSREFEECSFDFHRRKSSRTKDPRKERETKEASKTNNDLKERQKKEASKGKSDVQESKKENTSRNLASTYKEVSRVMVSESISNKGSYCEDKKRVRTQTFNQLTAPYHEPFCLDIYISKASVRACIIHRVTSKVVVVAHSISKDMKFDLSSTRNASACAAVGGILAQRALADDVHDVVYTPRKGEKLEGRLQIVVQAIIDNGVNVKVKLKQRKVKRASYLPSA
ncbi:Ribosomal protein [Melia azedarach]|uniref:Ribosomal protein n=2 Tax=Melia azedarach TaxID=155640 RepID=A0ACC1YG94_MELAZ|nr:Ribosomal protein [Melia azedarach]KAJ4722462.1 Ribosomal protein [Melia azedarach]